MRKSKFEVQLNTDIREYTDKPLLGLSWRQLIFGGLGLAVGTVVYILSMNLLGTGAAAACCAFAALPFMALGFYKWHGLPLEMFFKIWIRSNIMTPRFLPFRPKEPDCLLLIQSKEKMKPKKGRKKTHE